MISSDLSQREGGAEPSLSWVPSPGGPASPRFSAHSPASLLGTLSPWLCLLSPGLCSLPLGPERETPHTEGRVGSGCTELELREPGSSGTGPAQLAACSDHMGYSPSRPAPGSPCSPNHPAAWVLPQAKCRAEARAPSEKRLWVQRTESPRPPSSCGRQRGQAGRAVTHLKVLCVLVPQKRDPHRQSKS